MMNTFQHGVTLEGYAFISLERKQKQFYIRHDELRLSAVAVFPLIANSQKS